jgi:hypothetical protein
MSFRLPLKHYFRVEERRSNDQLAMDFREFPPFPLRCTEKDSVVRIVRAAGIGGLLNCLQISRKWFFIGGSGPDVSIRSSIESELARYGAMELVEHLNNGTRRCPKNIRPLVVRAFMLGLVLLQTFVLSRIMYRSENGLGVFFPTDDSSGRISLTEAATSLRTGIEAILSHEHLHFLQHQDGERHEKVVKNLSQFVREKSHGNVTLLYILEKREVEARLYELVLSWYRTKKELPLTPEGFLDILCASPCFYERVVEFLRMDGYAVGKDVTFCEERDTMFSSQLGDAFAYMTDSHCQYRFVTEVLTVMYGNLLRYYGDKEACQRYLAEISRPNLYDSLYGTDSIAV